MKKHEYLATQRIRLNLWNSLILSFEERELMEGRQLCRMFEDSALPRLFLSSPSLFIINQRFLHVGYQLFEDVRA